VVAAEDPLGAPATGVAVLRFIAFSSQISDPIRATSRW
jgi:hypothetical protein